LPAHGSATLHGGSRDIFGFGHDSIHAGSGNATMIGAGHHEHGGSFTHMVAHGFNDSWTGGHSHVFAFDHSVTGGQHLIQNFAHGSEHLNHGGWDSTAGAHHSHLHSGSAVISLDEGKTQIVLHGVNHFGKHDG
jgi:hypothetical protein